MANLTEEAVWEDGIYQLEEHDPVLGGVPNLAEQKGFDNVPHQQLARRTAWLKSTVATLTARISNAYASDKPNTSIRMGSDSAGNFDGLTYDDATNTIVAKADANKNGTATGNSRYMAGRLRASSTADVTETSTDHALELGNFDGGNGLKADSNEVLSRSGGVQKSVLWANVLQKGDITTTFWSSPNASDDWLIGENFKGDTTVGLGAAFGFCHRVGSLAQVSLDLDFTNFSIVPNDDGFLGVRVDLAAIGAASGWFSEISMSAIVAATGEFSGDGWDAPLFPMYASISSNGGSFPNTLLLQAKDTRNQPVQTTNATGLTVRTTFTVKVGD